MQIAESLNRARFFLTPSYASRFMGYYTVKSLRSSYTSIYQYRHMYGCLAESVFMYGKPPRDLQTADEMPRDVSNIYVSFHVVSGSSSIHNIILD